MCAEGQLNGPCRGFSSVWLQCARLTAEFTPLEPGVLEHKYYARGIGLVLVVTVKGGGERAEPISIDRGK